MTDWQDATNLMRVEKKKSRTKKNGKSPVGLRCWDCGQYLVNLNAGHYCSDCLLKHLKKFGFIQAKESPCNK